MQTSLVAAQLRPTLDVPDLLRHADLVIRGQPHRGGRAAPQAGAHLRLAVREKVWVPSGGENSLQDVANGVQEGGRDPSHR